MSTDRYDQMKYRRSGRSGLFLPEISLGLWHNFGNTDSFANCRALCTRAFELGVTHFDLANNYGPPPGGAEDTFGRILREDFAAHRDELIISTKAGYRMWPGPYGDGGSRKYLLASLDQSLRRLGLDYVDVFYSHRPDPGTPLEETMGALAQAIRSGKALYAGLSNYSPDMTRQAAALLRDMGVPLLIHQPRYNMLDRRHEKAGLFPALDEVGTGCIAFSPLEQGILGGRYFEGIPADSRAGTVRSNGAVQAATLSQEKITKARELNEIAKARGQSLAQLAVQWVLRVPQMTSVLIGASKTSQIEQIQAAIHQAPLNESELAQIETILG